MLWSLPSCSAVAFAFETVPLAQLVGVVMFGHRLDGSRRVVDGEERRVGAIRGPPEALLGLFLFLDLELTFKCHLVDRRNQLALELRIAIHDAAGLKEKAPAKPHLTAQPRVFLWLARNLRDVDLDDLDKLVEPFRLALVAQMAQHISDRRAVAAGCVEFDSYTLTCPAQRAHTAQHDARNLMRI